MATLQYDFAVVNEAKLGQAFARIERRGARHARVMERHLRKAQGGSIGTGGRGTSAVAAQARIQATQVKETARTERARMAQSERMQIRQRKEQEKAQAAQAREAAKRAKESARVQALQRKEQERAERRVIKDRERAAKREAVEKKRSLVAEQRERDKMARKQERADKVRAREVASYQRKYQASVRRKVDRGLGAAAGVGIRAAQMVGLAATGVVAAGLYRGVGLQQRQTQLLLGAKQAEDQGLLMPQEELGTKIRQTAIAHRVGAEDITSGLEAFVRKTGDLSAGIKNMEVWATVAKATGSTFEDISDSAADMYKKFDVRTPEQMAEAFTTLLYQGKKGAFELRDMAQYLPEIGAAAARAGLRGTRGVAELGGIAQMAIESSGSGAEASTAIMRMFDTLIENAKDLQSGRMFGGRKVKVFEGGDPRKGLRPIMELLPELLAATRADKIKFNKLFNVRARKAVSEPFRIGSEAYQAARAGGATPKQAEKAMADAIRAAYADAMSGGGSYAEVQKEAKIAEGTAASELTMLKERFFENVETSLLPALTKLAPKVEGLVEPFGNLVLKLTEAIEWFAENPFAGIGALMAAAAVKEVAGAAIGAQISKLITSIIVRSAPASMAIPGVGGTAGAAGTAAGGAGAGVVSKGASAFLPTVAAVAASSVALEQVSKLQQETGAGDLRRIVPGFDKHSKFSAGRMVADLALGPMMLGLKGASIAHDVITEDERKNEAAIADAQWRQKQREIAGGGSSQIADFFGGRYGAEAPAARPTEGLWGAITSMWADPGAPNMNPTGQAAPASSETKVDMTGVEQALQPLQGTLNVRLTNPEDIKTGSTGGLNRSDLPMPTSGG
jgi:hypothetical protein